MSGTQEIAITIHSKVQFLGRQCCQSVVRASCWTASVQERMTEGRQYDDEW